MTKIAEHKDAELIRRFGGPAALAQRLGYDKANGGTQRVQNWLTRGVPPAVKLDHPDVFLTQVTAAAAAGASAKGE